jgi:hypothetical protein
VFDGRRLQRFEFEHRRLQILVDMQHVSGEGEVARHVNLWCNVAEWCNVEEESCCEGREGVGRQLHAHTLSRMRKSRSNRDSSELGRSTFSETLFLLLYLQKVMIVL